MPDSASESSAQVIAITKAQFDRTVSDLRSYAQEHGKVHIINSTFYFFGSELAVLRLLKAYRHNKDARVDFSLNCNSHFFALDCPSFYGSMTAE